MSIPPGVLEHSNTWKFLDVGFSRGEGCDVVFFYSCRVIKQKLGCAKEKVSRKSSCSRLRLPSEGTNRGDAIISNTLHIQKQVSYSTELHA